MSETVPVAQLRAFVERIERIEADIKDLNADKSEVYKELRGCGFDVKAVRAVVAKRKLDTADREERDAMFDLYWSALNGEDRARAHAREIIEEFDAETGEIRDEPEAAAEVAGDYLREPVAAEQGQIIREGDAPRETDRLGGDASRPDAESHSQAISSSHGPAIAGEAPSSSQASPATHSVDFDPVRDIPAFMRRTDRGCMAQYGHGDTDAVPT